MTNTLLPSDGFGRDWIANRYELREKVGQGGDGMVFKAHDHVLDRAVAVKIALPGRSAGIPHIRAEVALLSALSIPGVVGYLDHGIDRGRPYLVLDLVDGSPFPAITCPAAWEDLAPAARSLLDVLARVHARGVTHRDLKPSNVLMDVDGRAQLLDFGLSVGPAVVAGRHDASQWSGTPAYVAPERIDPSLRASTGDSAQEDLYALGVMLFESLVGEPPHPALRARSLVAQRLAHPAPRVSSRAPSVPRLVADVVDALLERDPTHRPGSVGEVMECLFAAENAAERPARLLRIGRGPGRETDPLSEREVRAWIAGPDRVLHLREDGARGLVQLTAGDPLRMDSELLRMEREGLAHWERGRLVLERATVDQLLRSVSDWEAEITDGDAAAHGDDPAAMQRVLHRAAVWTRTGRAGDARAILTGMLALLRDGPIESRRAVLAQFALTALSARTRMSVALALHEIDRVPEDDRPRSGSVEMLRAAKRILEGASASALQRLEHLGPRPDRGLEYTRRILMASAARDADSETQEAIHDNNERWAAETGDERLVAAVGGLRAHRHYGRGEYDVAARLHVRAAVAAEGDAADVTEYLNAAAAWIEAGSLEDARSIAELARDRAAQRRNVLHQGFSEELLRKIEYRAGAATHVDTELLDALEQLGSPRVFAPALLTEAAVAWRSCENTLARELALRGARAFERAAHPPGALIARCLAVATGARVPMSETRQLWGRACECALPGIALQCLALLAPWTEHDAADARERAVRLVAKLPSDSLDRVREVLSAREARAGLESPGVASWRTPPRIRSP